MKKKLKRFWSVIVAFLIAIGVYSQLPTYISGSTVTYSATATDDGTGVERVEFYVAGALVFTDTEAPYTTIFDSTILPDGQVTLEVRAFDFAGNMGSDTKMVTVDNNPPNVTITSP